VPADVAPPTVDTLATGEALPTATSLGLLACGTCRLVTRPQLSESGSAPLTPRPAAGGALAAVSAHNDPSTSWRCPRCRSLLLPRKRDSIARTWALLIAALALYLPANTLPIMQTSSLFGFQRDTIMSGILYLWESGSWPLAIIVFIASFLVPLTKILALSFLLVSVQRRWRHAARERTVLYRILEFVGRWSMLDIFVLSLLVALVQVRSLAQIRAEPGAIAFGAVVVLTMLAALSFDPRLIWDAAEAAEPVRSADADRPAGPSLSAERTHGS
jgi:uncharacterized paraquat-inducible protein A